MTAPRSTADRTASTDCVVLVAVQAKAPNSAPALIATPEATMSNGRRRSFGAGMTLC